MQLIEQRLVARERGAVVTLLEHADLRKPSVVDGDAILEPGSAVVWFSFPALHHDIGRFHLADDTFTGLYANVLTPVEGLEVDEWRTTDLFLDVWVPAGGPACVLDEAELEDALAQGWIDRAAARVARAEADRLMQDARAGVWPPAIVADWTLERARAVLAEGPAHRHTRGDSV